MITRPVLARPSATLSSLSADKVVPTSANMSVAHKQFWLGPRRAGLVARFWADCNLIHVSICGARIKTIRSHLSTAWPLSALTREG